jgi:hypothetical protein
MHVPVDRAARRVARIAVPVLLGVSAVLSLSYMYAILATPLPTDWALFVEASRRVWGRGLYEESATYAFRWSPVLAYALGPITALGPWLWRAGQVALAVAMPDRRLSLLVLLAYPFWFDVWLGNVNILILWLAAWALTGHRWAVVGFLVAAVLIPRPLVVPLVIYLLWRQPWTRIPFVAIFASHSGAVLATGWGPEWIGRLVATGSEMSSIFNLSPSRWIGLAWLPIGIALGAVAFVRGRPALAGLFVTPYVLPYYLLLPLAELARRDGAGRSRQPVADRIAASVSRTRAASRGTLMVLARTLRLAE